jgi:hypothetical protein
MYSQTYVQRDPKVGVVVDRWSLLTDGRFLEVIYVMKCKI